MASLSSRPLRWASSPSFPWSNSQFIKVYAASFRIHRSEAVFTSPVWLTKKQTSKVFSFKVCFLLVKIVPQIVQQGSRIRSAKTNAVRQNQSPKNLANKGFSGFALFGKCEELLPLSAGLLLLNKFVQKMCFLLSGRFTLSEVCRLSDMRCRGIATGQLQYSGCVWDLQEDGGTNFTFSLICSISAYVIAVNDAHAATM